VLEALRFGGEVLDLQIGLRAGQLFDPVSGAQSGILSTGYYMLGAALLRDARRPSLAAARRGGQLRIVPVGGISSAPSSRALVGRTSAPACSLLGLQVAGPVMVALLLADLAFGLVARAVPQINVFLVGIPAKIALAFALAAVRHADRCCINIGAHHAGDGDVS
jgi:flagellar biosynthetic protein FliR